MRRFMIIFSIVIGFGLLFGSDGYAGWTNLLGLIIMLIGVFYMFTRRVLPQLVETLLIVLFVPMLVIYLYYFITNLFRSHLSNPNMDISLWPFLVIAFLLSFFASLYVIRIRRQNQRLEQGSEREPVVPHQPSQNN